jgi:site-specific DNA recombinase
MSKPKSGPVRCAIYTRKSSEEGLDQAFNSLHAQREACEAYVKSQAGEGWKAIKTAYDDGGYSGGAMERPGLKALLADVKARKVDVVVVYKVDRLTRSLADFAKMVELFDAAGVSFVSVTQAFNTTTSMGRLTLNVLLSFAQFEREVTGERIRDKIAASKAKGMWMGGMPPLGYDPPVDLATRSLALNPAEADRVRLIFDRYLALGSVAELRRELERTGIRSKAWTSRAGKPVGGEPFSTGALFYLLRNRVYLGEIVHAGQRNPGSHPPIITPELFEAVQKRLADNAIRRTTRVTRASSALLKGRLFDADGALMSPSFGYGRGGKLYRYYVSAPLCQGSTRKSADTAPRRIPGPQLDALVQGWVERLGLASELHESVRLHVPAQGLTLTIAPEAIGKGMTAEAALARLQPKLTAGEHAWAEEDRIEIASPVRVQFRGGRSWIIGGAADPTTPKPNPKLISGLRRAHQKLAAVLAGETTIDTEYDRNLARLAFLAPDLQQRLLEGRHPRTLTLQQLVRTDFPLAWSDQAALLGG